MNYKGKLISVEGLEGVGKSTVMSTIQAWSTDHLEDPIITREPGGTEISEKIRDILISHHDDALAGKTELLLMFAARAQLFEQRIQPALEQGRWVITDRFVDASYAYQGGGRQIDLRTIKHLHRFVLNDFEADLTLLLDASMSVSKKRMVNRSLDRIESETEAFFHRVRQTYLDLAKQFPDRYRIINAELPKEEVRKQVVAELERFIL
ncbi:MAG TPA: dTMP kinase [Gammaproteobacteria bacterium]|nr:dTMP kinase [Gammaproteobacteria bacterium]